MVAVRINPSVLSADFVNMERDLQKIRSADAVHVDIMDNHFVPNLTFGPQMTKRIQETSPIPLDVHLMITDVDRFAPQYAECGVECVTFHVEASSEPQALVRDLKAVGAKAGLSVKPGTPIEPFLPLVGDIDQLLVMTVEPGFGGQQFMPEVLGKVSAVAREARQVNPGLWIQVDGGIALSTIGQARAAGANTFVAGSAVYATDVSPEEAIYRLRREAEKTPLEIEGA